MSDTALKKKIEEMESTASHLLKVASEIRVMAGIDKPNRKPKPQVRTAIRLKFENHFSNNKKAALR